MPTETTNDPAPAEALSSAMLTGSHPRPGLRLGLDLACTKIAVDLQNMTEAGAEVCIRQSLEVLRQSTDADATFVAFLDASGSRFESVPVSKGTFGQCTPEVLKGDSLDSLPWLSTRLDHLRVVELRDTAVLAREHLLDGQRLQHLRIGAALLIGFSVQGKLAGFIGLCTVQARASWDAELHLLLKLIGASFASGLERLRMQAHLTRLQDSSALSLATSNEGVWDFDAVANHTEFSPRWKAMLGYRDDEMNHSPDWRELIHPDDLSRVRTGIREHIEGRSPVFESVHRVRHRNGEWRWVSSRAKARLDEQGRLLRLVGAELDITERRLFEEALFREKESAQVTLQSIGDGVITADEHSRVEYLNPVAEELTGWKLEDAQGRPIGEIFRAFHEETCEPLENPMSVAIRRERPVKSVRPMLLIRRDGNELYVDSTAAPIPARHSEGDKPGKARVGGGVLVFHDVSESRELNRRLSYHASHDVLTGLVNRREFEARLERALKSARARENAYAICYLDLDQFKIINDTCGHSAGDALLGQVGALLKSKIRWRDTLARLGGDEFGVLLENCTLEEALRMAETLRETVRNFRFLWEERTFRMGASVGVVPVAADNADVASIISAADSACAAAKEAGRNRVHSFAENDIELMRRRREMQWAARINNALEESRFELFRQTIQPLQKQDQGAHYELLLRMRDETGKIVSPDNFITAAERYGITPSIDRWVIENAFRWLVSEADERERLSMCSINLSGLSLGDDKFLPFVIEQFHRSGLDARKICFEITETSAVASFSQANRFIRSLRELGCRFALDDFGTGLSSFGYLKHFPVDFLKIDGSFVKEILHDPIDREMVRSINEIGHLTGKQTIAEFAENQEIIQMLRGLGVDYAQGYGVSKPQRVLKAVNA